MVDSPAIVTALAAIATSVPDRAGERLRADSCAVSSTACDCCPAARNWRAASWASCPPEAPRQGYPLYQACCVAPEFRCTAPTTSGRSKTDVTAIRPGPCSVSQVVLACQRVELNQ